jgi:hypothetical protein
MLLLLLIDKGKLSKSTILYMTKGWRRGLGGKQILSLKTLELN